MNSKSSSIDEILKLPTNASSSPPKQKSLTHTAQHLTDTPFITRLKEKKPKRTKRATKKTTRTTTKGKKRIGKVHVQRNVKNLSKKNNQRIVMPMLTIVVVSHSVTVLFVKLHMVLMMNYGYSANTVNNGCTLCVKLNSKSIPDHKLHMLLSAFCKFIVKIIFS